MQSNPPPETDMPREAVFMTGAHGSDIADDEGHSC